MEKEEWKYLLINGKFKTLEVKNPVYEGVNLQTIEGLKPFDKKGEDGSPIAPTVADAIKIKRETYISFFRKPFKNLLILTGAGASMDIGGSSMAVLWGKADGKYKISEGDTVKENNFKIICDSVKHDYEDKNLETLLSRIERTIEFNDDLDIKLNGADIKLSIIKKDLFDIIKTNCLIPKPANSGKFLHKVLLEKLLQRKLTSPSVKVFTLNYDLLFEYASEEINAVMIDGFSYTFPRTFSGRFFDYDIVQREGSKLQEEDNFIQRVFHLHKLHGSINWERKGDKTITNKENTFFRTTTFHR